MKKQLSAILLLLFLVSGCSTMESWMPEMPSMDSLNPFLDDESEAAGKVTEIAKEKEPESEVQTPMLAVNPYLWQASLDKLSFMPLASADSKGGVIVTDWKTMTSEPNEQFKVIVKISTRELRADGVKAVVYERILQNGIWVDKDADKRLADELEKGILYKAREMLRRDVMSR